MIFTKAKLVAILALMILVPLLLPPAKLTFEPRTIVSFGENDLIPYWSAYHIAQEGGDPYNIEALLRYGGGSQATAVGYRFLYAPWFLALFTPVFDHSLELSAIIWAIYGVIFGVASIFLFISLVPNRISTPKALLSGFLFLPLIHSLSLGQTGLLLTLGVAIAAYGLCKMRPLLLALGLVLLSLKAPAFYLFLLYVLFELLRQRNFRPLIFAFAIFLMLMAGSAMIVPSAVQHYNPLAVSPTDVMTSTLVTQIRQLILEGTGELVQWPLFAVPLASAAIFTWWWLRRVDKPKPELLIPPLLCLSFFTSPYAWFHDFSALLCVPVMLFAMAEELPFSQKKSLVLFLIAQQVGVVITLSFNQSLSSLFWFPLTMAGIWFYGTSCALNQSSPSSRQAPITLHPA